MTSLLQLAALVQAAPDASAEGLGLGGALLRMILVLGVVIALIYLTLNFGLRRLMGVQGFAAGRARIVSVVERIPLDQRRSMFVVKAAGEYLLVGAGEAQLSLIARLDTETVERIEKELREAQTRSPQLSPFLQKLLTRRNDAKPPPPPPSA